MAIHTPIGWLSVSEDQDTLLGLDINTRKPGKLQTPSRFSRDVLKQLKAYFSDPRYIFDLSTHLQGSRFQLRVWRALQKIPVGRVMTYGELAARLNSSPRAVGNACRANPVPIIIPCHRVVAANGIGGYAGKTTGPVLERKRWLLAHEGVVL